MFQPQPTPYGSFAHGVGPGLLGFAFQSQSLTGVHPSSPYPETHQTRQQPQQQHPAPAVGAGVGTSAGTGTGVLLGAQSPITSHPYTTAAPPQSFSSPQPQRLPPAPPPPPPPASRTSSQVAANLDSVVATASPSSTDPTSPSVSSSVALSSTSTSTTPPISTISIRQQPQHALQYQRQPHQSLHHTHRPEAQYQHQHQHPHQLPTHSHMPQQGGSCSRYTLRSQGKMEGDIQQAEDIAAQEVAARDYKAQHQGQLVGDKVSSDAITEEYAKADPIYVTKTMALPQTYSHYRPIRGDGNCGWRAIAFSYFEYLIDAGDGNLVQAELARLMSLNNFLISNGYEMTLFEDMVQETFDLLKDISLNIDSPADAMSALMARFTDDSIDNAIIYHLRMLAGACLKSDPTPYEHFIPGSGGISEFVQSTIEVPHREIEQIGINLIVKILLQPVGLVLEIAYLDRTPGSEVNTYRFPEESGTPETGPTATTTLCLLFRPDHYDIVYRRPLPPTPSAPTNISVHRVDHFAHQIHPQQTPATMSGFGPAIDLTTFATLIPGYGAPTSGMSSLTTTQPSPLSETYSPASPTTWGMMPPFAADQMAQVPIHRPVSPVQSMQPVAVDLAHPVRFSKYNYRELVEDSGYQEPQFQTTAFKNSQFNKAHYNNPNFQPEEFRPDLEPGSGRGHKKRG